MLVLSPVAGALVDRSNRKLMMIVSDLASGVATIAILILYTAGRLEIWHLYITSGFTGAFQTFQWPAFSAAITTMLPKEQYGRANGMLSLAESGSGIFAPVLAGALLGLIGLGGILALDIFTFVFAITALLIVYVPQPEVTEVGRESKGSLWQESVFGFSYIIKRPSLLGLQLVFMVGNFIATIAFILVAPMILASTGNDELIYGTANSIAAVGGLVGGLVMSAWGGFKRQVHGVLLGWMFSGLFTMLMGLGDNLLVWSIAGFAGFFFSPVINSSNQAIWQAKVAPDVQGRVFSIRRLIAWLVNPLAMLAAGPLADRVMEPAMQEGGALVPSFGPLVGVGPGAGMSMIMVFAGVGVMLVGLGGYAFTAVRDAETILADHDMAAAPAAIGN
jgi:MFS family permease